MKNIFEIEETFNNMRLDRWIRNKFGSVPQSLIEKHLRNGNIKINKKRAKSSFKVKTNDKIYMFKFNFQNKLVQKKIKFKPNDEIIKENEDLLIDNNDDFVVLNKSAGIAVQGGTKSKKNLVDIFTNSEIFDQTKPYSVHRLDKDTSGVFILAKNRKSAQLLTTLFRLRKVYKTYLAICHGELEKDKGIWKGNLIRYEGKKQISEKAETAFSVIDKNSNSTLVQMKPITGRKHQLRKQLFIEKHSIIGDKKYNSQKDNKSINKNLMLHSYQIKFRINDKKYTYRASLPEYFKKMLKTKRLNFQNNLID